MEHINLWNVYGRGRGWGWVVFGIKKPDPDPGHPSPSSVAVSNLHATKVVRQRWGLPATLFSENISRLTCTWAQRKGGRLYVGLCLWDSNGCAVNSAVRMHIVTLSPHPIPYAFSRGVTENASVLYTRRVHISTCVPVMLTYAWFSSVSRQMPEYYINSATTSSLRTFYSSLSTYHSTFLPCNAKLKDL
jgi:hypothetical protein